eukprot:8704465-Alexandrium_andersonii.AAC.1
MLFDNIIAYAVVYFVGLLGVGNYLGKGNVEHGKLYDRLPAPFSFDLHDFMRKARQRYLVTEQL